MPNVSLDELLNHILSENELEDNTCRSVLNIVMNENVLNYNILNHSKIKRYLKNNLSLFSSLKPKRKLELIFFTLEHNATSKNIKLILDDLPKHNHSDKKLVLNKIYEVALIKKLSGLDKSDYVELFLKSRRSEFEDKLFDYIFDNFQFDKSECFGLLKKSLKENQKNRILYYVVSNFELDRSLSRRLLHFDFSYEIKKKLFDNIVNSKQNHWILLKISFSDSPFKDYANEELIKKYPNVMINYLKKRTIIFESEYDFENDYEVELQLLNHNKNYFE
jgi:hypothetical protein